MLEQKVFFSSNLQGEPFLIDRQKHPKDNTPPKMPSPLRRCPRQYAPEEFAFRVFV